MMALTMMAGGLTGSTLLSWPSSQFPSTFQVQVNTSYVYHHDDENDDDGADDDDHTDDDDADDDDVNCSRSSRSSLFSSRRQDSHQPLLNPCRWAQLQ